jgi:hypothetical protein
MSCPVTTPHYLEPIADDIVDKSTVLYPNHTVYTHLGCAVLRTIMGVVLLESSDSSVVRPLIIVVMVLSIIVFWHKYLSNVFKGDDVVWKVYLRTLLAYSTSTYLSLAGHTQIAGALLITDALMGVQSRHMASVLSCRAPK